MDKETLAALLNKRQYNEEITNQEANDAKNAGLLVVFGASDDLIEFRGLFSDEMGCYGDKTEIMFDKEGPIPPWDEMDGCSEEEAENYFRRKSSRKKITTFWCRKGSSATWSYETDVPHATFDICEDGDIFCRGMVMDVKDIVQKGES